METIITRNTGTQETRGDEDYKLKPKQNHCYGHTPQIQKGAKTSNTGVERMPFVTRGKRPNLLTTGVAASLPPWPSGEDGSLEH